MFMQPCLLEVFFEFSGTHLTFTNDNIHFVDQTPDGHCELQIKTSKFI